MYAILLMDKGNGPYQLGESLLNFVNRQGAMIEEVVVQLVACHELILLFRVNPTITTYQDSIPAPTTPGSPSQ